VSTPPISRERSERPCAELPDQRDDWRSQFAHPRGWPGRLAGWLMARRNAAMNAACVEWLAAEPDDRVLEIGFGHGRTIAWLAARTGPDGFVAGVDPSDTMLRQASAWNRDAIASGRVQLAKGDTRRIPFPDRSFDHVLATNCVQFWGDLPSALAEIRRVLAPGGGLLIGIRVHDPRSGRFASPGFRPEQIAAVRAVVERAGFGEVRTLRRNVGRDVVGIHAWSREQAA
jgi:ubiquinone/menaquinone biosynthesis C-methylase UbiE